MNILIVVCHPSKKSYVFRILEQLKQELVQKNIDVEVSDLYAMNFRSDMTKEEYEREGFSKTDLPIPIDVLQEHEKINRADCIVFLYPVWWSGCPAKLKGWFDRVFCIGYAYKQKDNVPKMKAKKYGIVICTAGYTKEHLQEIGIAQSMENILLNDRLGGRFERKEMIILGGALEIELVNDAHTEQIKDLANNIVRVAS